MPRPTATWRFLTLLSSVPRQPRPATPSAWPFEVPEALVEGALVDGAGVLGSRRGRGLLRRGLRGLVRGRAAEERVAGGAARRRRARWTNRCQRRSPGPWCP